MIPLNEAETNITTVPVYPETEVVPLTECSCRILAEDIISPLNIPGFHKSAMDGYAINSSDHSPEYKVIEVIPAGKVPIKRIGTGECAKIMTGAMVPMGADRVVIKEVVEEKKGIMRITGEDPNVNICFMGEDVKQGDKVLFSGTLIRPQEVAVIASMGKVEVHVYKRPLVGVIATGSELIEPGQALLKQGQIFNSNSYSIAAQVKKTGARVYIHGVAVDTEKDIMEAIESLLHSCDMILLSGGVSVGDYDLVPGILQKLNVAVHFEKIAVKPGKPTHFGTKGKTFFFGVPGNPVSTFVIFELLIKSLLYRMMGHTYVPLILEGTLTMPVKRKRAGRSAFVPVLYDHGKVEPVEYHGSAHIHALTKANGLVNIKRGVHEIPAGKKVDVRSI
jgi:molybdopterin molybdotransferase